MICQKVKPNHSSLAQAECKSLISGLKTHQNLVWVFQSRELRTVEIFLYQDLSTNIDEEMGEINTVNVVSLSFGFPIAFTNEWECWEKTGVTMAEQGLTQECQLIQTFFLTMGRKDKKMNNLSSSLQHPYFFSPLEEFMLFWGHPNVLKL